MTLQGDLDAIAERQGKSVPAGNFIAGFGPGTAPPPSDASLPEYRRRTVEDDEDDFADRPLGPIDSPMIPKARPPYPEPLSPADLAPAPENLSNFQAPVFDLTILGMDATIYAASYQGRQVELSKQEAAAVRKVVLQAIVRGIKAQLDAAAALLPKRKRKAVEPKKEQEHKPPIDLLTEVCFPGGIIPPPDGMPGITKRKRKRAGGDRRVVGQHGEGQPGSPGGFVAPDAAGSSAPLVRRRGRPRKVQP